MTVVVSWILVALGVILIVRTLAAGIGGGLGLLLGALFIAAGAARLYLHRRTSSG